VRGVVLQSRRKTPEGSLQQSGTRGQRAESTERASWRLKIPESPLRLDDDRLLE
jgi:hypothetical protein